MHGLLPQAKPAKHTAAELKAKEKAATTNMGGGKAGQQVRWAWSTIAAGQGAYRHAKPCLAMHNPSSQRHAWCVCVCAVWCNAASSTCRYMHAAHYSMADAQSMHSCCLLQGCGRCVLLAGPARREGRACQVHVPHLQDPSAINHKHAGT